MSIFNWVKDIEETYDELIEKAQKENKSELNNLKEQEETNLKQTLDKKRNFIERVLNELKQDIDFRISNFKQKINKEIEKTEKDYKSIQDQIIKQVLSDIGVDF